ncbi:uncharacterized protein LOC118190585, partial [Stegodyphus dumicola]|uniref:uncharacterized protein LOC118190585 n=1 Tax=Stegodyphus dumicola TaxID=202533 RepID=UPI0015ABDCA8
MTEMNFRIIIVQQTSEEVKLETCVKEITPKIEACGLVVNSLNFVNLQNVENEDYVEVEELSIHVQAIFHDNMRLEKRVLYEDFCEKWKNQYLPNHCPVLVLYENDSFINRRLSCHCRVSYSNISFGVLPHNGLFLEYASFDIHHLINLNFYKVDFYHDTRNLRIKYNNYEMRSSYDNIRKIFINIDSCPCEMFLDLCNPFLIFRLEKRCNDTNEEYSVDHRAGVLPSNGSKIDTDTLGRSNVLKLSINDLDIVKEIIGRIHFRCSEKPIHYLNVTSRRKKLPLDPVIDFFHFGCTYTLTAIIKRNFTMIEQTTNIKAEITRLDTLCNKDGDCLENALINILKAVDSGLIVNLWIEVQKQFTHYLNSKDEINYIHYIVPLKSRMIRRITLTPTRQILWPPEIMFENRVLRNFDSEYALRISFRDDNMKKLSYCASYAEPCILQSAVKEPMLGGIRIGKRLYEFLAWSNSQIRDHGVWMYARDRNGNTVSDIREWMGDFSHIRSVSKYMVRMGQCFSQTEDAISVPLDPSHIRTEDDIEDGIDLANFKPYCFSEGIGKISVQLANEVSALRSSAAALSSTERECCGESDQSETRRYYLEQDIYILGLREFHSHSPCHPADSDIGARCNPPLVLQSTTVYTGSKGELGTAVP